MSSYLWTPDELRERGTLLGKMTEDNHANYLVKAKEIGEKAGYSKPALGITVEFKPETGKEDQPYPVSPREWDLFIRDIPEFCRKEPEVYVFDGDVYALPI